MKPILFNTDMVRAILADRKTVTRRVVKGADPEWHFVGIEEHLHEIRIKANGEIYPKELDGPRAVFYAGNGYYDFPMIKTPYRPGDILYVRESFFEHNGHYYYKADGKHEALAQLGITFKWHPSIHMPREAARIFLRVKDVRVERLQEITEEQAQAEGAKGWMVATDRDWDKNPNHLIAFRHLWDSTIKKADRALYSWEANPWVWVTEFERCEKPEGE